MGETETLADVRNMLLPAVSSPSYGMDKSADILIDHKAGSLVVRDKYEVGFVLTRREIESGDYKFVFNPRMTDWRDRRLSRRKE